MGFLRNSRLGLTPEEQQQKLQRMRAVKEILIKEYDDALEEFDRAKENPQILDQASAACQRYITAMRRLNKFLMAEEIPPDVAEKLP
jgi:hypothetical protein